jgi:uncharacterized protein YkwD
MLRWTTLVLVLLAFSGASASAEPVLLPQAPVLSPLRADGTASPGALKLFGGTVVQELNRVRAARGLQPLRSTPSLAVSARRHSVEMGQRGFFAHESADGTPFWRRIERVYVDNGFRSWEVGENIFWQSPASLAAISVVRSWLASPGHRANVLSRTWHDVGVGAVSLAGAPGVYRGATVTIVTVDFGKRRR